MTYDTSAYLLEDHPRTLFPMNTTCVLVNANPDALLEFAYQDLLDKDKSDLGFVVQERCHAAKEGFHLRRTLKLDPVAELTLYDLVYRNRRCFRPDHQEHRRSYGYRFSGGRPMSPMSSYREFRNEVHEAFTKYQYSLKLDVAAYFNSLYHHDLREFADEAGWSPKDVAALAQLLRQINAGRSVDCLPHGLNPSKAIGAEFLKFVDNSARLRSDLLLRFTDDIYLFSDSYSVLIDDLIHVQTLIGEKSLSLNASKTKFDEGLPDVPGDLTALKIGLLQRRQTIIEVSGKQQMLDEVEQRPLSDGEVEYLLGLLRDPDLEEPDAELVLALLRDHGEEVLDRMAAVLPRFPNVTKAMHTYMARWPEAVEVVPFVRRTLTEAPNATEYQLFWLAKILQQFGAHEDGYGGVSIALFEHPNATTITQAKILEIPEHRFGMPDLRREQLRSGQSNWLAWSAAVGSRKQKSPARNHMLGYFANASPINKVIAGIVKAI